MIYIITATDYDDLIDTVFDHIDSLRAALGDSVDLYERVLIHYQIDALRAARAIVAICDDIVRYHQKYNKDVIVGTLTDVAINRFGALVKRGVLPSQSVCIIARDGATTINATYTDNGTVTGGLKHAFFHPDPPFISDHE